MTELSRTNYLTRKKERKDDEFCVLDVGFDSGDTTATIDKRNAVVSLHIIKMNPFVGDIHVYKVVHIQRDGYFEVVPTLLIKCIPRLIVTICPRRDTHWDGRG